MIKKTSTWRIHWGDDCEVIYGYLDEDINKLMELNKETHTRTNRKTFTLSLLRMYEELSPKEIKEEYW